MSAPALQPELVGERIPVAKLLIRTGHTETAVGTAVALTPHIMITSAHTVLEPPAHSTRHNGGSAPTLVIRFENESRARTATALVDHARGLAFLHLRSTISQKRFPWFYLPDDHDQASTERRSGFIAYGYLPAVGENPIIVSGRREPFHVPIEGVRYIQLTCDHESDGLNLKNLSGSPVVSVSDGDIILHGLIYGGQKAIDGRGEATVNIGVVHAHPWQTIDESVQMIVPGGLWDLARARRQLTQRAMRELEGFDRHVEDLQRRGKIPKGFVPQAIQEVIIIVMTDPSNVQPATGEQYHRLYRKDRGR